MISATVPSTTVFSNTRNNDGVLVTTKDGGSLTSVMTTSKIPSTLLDRKLRTVTVLRLGQSLPVINKRKVENLSKSNKPCVFNAVNSVATFAKKPTPEPVLSLNCPGCTLAGLTVGETEVKNIVIGSACVPSVNRVDIAATRNPLALFSGIDKVGVGATKVGRAFPFCTTITTFWSTLEPAASVTLNTKFHV